MGLGEARVKEEYGMIPWFQAWVAWRMLVLFPAVDGGAGLKRQGGMRSSVLDMWNGSCIWDIH